VLKYKLHLIVVVAQLKLYSEFGVKKLLRVILGDPLCTGHVILRMRSELRSLHNVINGTFSAITWLNFGA